MVYRRRAHGKRLARARLPVHEAHRPTSTPFRYRSGMSIDPAQGRAGSLAASDDRRRPGGRLSGVDGPRRRAGSAPVDGLDPGGPGSIGPP